MPARAHCYSDEGAENNAGQCACGVHSRARRVASTTRTQIAQFAKTKAPNRKETAGITRIYWTRLLPNSANNWSQTNKASVSILGLLFFPQPSARCYWLLLHFLQTARGALHLEQLPLWEFPSVYFSANPESARALLDAAPSTPCLGIPSEEPRTVTRLGATSPSATALLALVFLALRTTSNPARPARLSVPVARSSPSAMRYVISKLASTPLRPRT